MKLYFAPRTRSTRPRWVLEELGVPYELVTVDVAAQEQKGEAYRQIHPLGHVPALVDGDTTIFESAAICLHLADRFPEKQLAPAPGSADRGLYYQWMFYAMVTVEPLVIALVEETQSLPAGQRNPARLEAARGRWSEVLGVVERALAGREFLVGAHLTAADVVMASVLVWARMLKLVEGHPNIDAYVTRLVSRPAAKAARS